MNKNPHFQIREINKNNRQSISEYLSENWESEFSVSRGKVHNTTLLPGFLCKMNDEIIGLVTYHIENNDCEIVTLNSELPNRGLGTKLINIVIERAKQAECKRVWLITTNDNTNAIRFYQKFGFEWVGFFRDAMHNSRKLKPEIPERGNDNIPIKHEIEFEIRFEAEN